MRSINKCKKVANLLLLICGICFFAFSESVNAESRYNFSGYFKTFNNLLKNPSFDGPVNSPFKKADFISINTLRLEFTATPSQWFALNIAYALLPTGGTATMADFNNILPRPDPFNYRFADIRNRFYPKPGDDTGKFSLSNNLDRFVMEFYLPFGDFRIGRQPVAFGSARFLNPTDVLAPFTFEELDTEERVGIDAIRFKTPVGGMGEFDIAWVFGDKARFSNSAAFSKIKLYAWNTDMTFMALMFRNNILLGFDFARSIGGASAWIEGAYTLASILDGYNSKDDYFRLSLGVDYNFAENLYAYIEYHFNGAGKIDSNDYALLLDTTAYMEGGVYLFGMHYLSFGSIYEISPLWHLNTNLVLNANDPSIFLIFRIEYNVAQNIYLDFGSYLSIGQISRLNASLTEPITVASEFGLYPNMYYVAGRFYF